MSLLRIDSSINTFGGSVSRGVTDTFVRAYTEQHPDAQVVVRDLAVDVPSAQTWALAAFAGHTPDAQRNDAQRAALAEAAVLADELLAADAVVIGAPLYNFGVPQTLKAWIDLVITDPRFSAGVQNPLGGKPVTLIVSRGGGYGEGTPRFGWDHATGYLRRILADVWGGELTVIEAELTLAEINPALAAFKEIGAASKARAHESAEATGKAVAQLSAA